MRARIMAAGAAALLAGTVVSATPAQAAHGANWTHLKCYFGAGTSATMDVTHDEILENHVLIVREDFAMRPALRPDKVQLMLSRRKSNGSYEDYKTIYTWGTGASQSVKSSFGSTALAGDTRYNLSWGVDRLKLKVTLSGEQSACWNEVGEGHT